MKNCNLFILVILIFSGVISCSSLKKANIEATEVNSDRKPQSNDTKYVLKPDEQVILCDLEAVVNHELTSEFIKINSFDSSENNARTTYVKRPYTVSSPTAYKAIRDPGSLVCVTITKK